MLFNKYERFSWCGRNNLRTFVVCFGLTLQGIQIGILMLHGRSTLEKRHPNRHLQAYQQPRPSTHQLPIIFMGLPHSGSLALHGYFECQGFLSRHYCCGRNSSQIQFPCQSATASPPQTSTCGECVLNNMKYKRPPFDGCQSGATQTHVQVWASFDIETRDQWFLPQYFAIGLLHQFYPNATWILNQRSDSRAWAESILHWHSKTQRIFSSYGLPLYPHPMTDPPNATSKVTTNQVLQDMERVLQERLYNQTDHWRKRDLLQNIYENHTRTIRKWAQQYPSHQLVEINVDTDDPDSVLREVLLRLSKQNGAVVCPWEYQPPDQDWKDFQLPFA